MRLMHFAEYIDTRVNFIHVFTPNSKNIYNHFFEKKKQENVHKSTLAVIIGMIVDRYYRY